MRLDAIVDPQPLSRAALSIEEKKINLTILEPESLYPGALLEQRVMGYTVRILQGTAKKSLLELPDEVCAQADSLMTLPLAVPKEAPAKFAQVKLVIRTGVRHDRVDRPA